MTPHSRGDPADDGDPAEPSRFAEAERRRITRWRWIPGLALYVLEVIAVGYIGLAFGGLSAMLSDTCFPESTELICDPNWQNILALTPVTTLLITVLAAGVLMVWIRRFWTLGVAYVATPLVPLVAFMIMQEVVTA